MFREREREREKPVKRCWNLPLGHCREGMQAVCVDATYLPGTVGQECRLFKRCQALWGRDESCFRVDATYLPGIVGKECRLFKR